MNEQQITERLQGLHLAAGSPSTRTVASRAGISHETVARALRGEPPRLPTLLKLVAALHGDVEEYKDLYFPPRIRGESVRPGYRELLQAIYEEVRAIRHLIQDKVSVGVSYEITLRGPDGEPAEYTIQLRHSGERPDARSGRKPA